MVTVQMLSELEEIIQFKLMPERREAIKQSWWKRLQVCDIFNYPVLYCNIPSFSGPIDILS